MTSHHTFFSILLEKQPQKPLFLDKLAKERHKLPAFVRHSPVAMRYLDLLSPLAWRDFPERSLKVRGPHRRTLRYASFAAAQLVKLEEGIRSTGGLWRYLYEHPGLSWLLGFEVQQSGFIP